MVRISHLLRESVSICNFVIKFVDKIMSIQLDLETSTDHDVYIVLAL